MLYLFHVAYLSMGRFNYSYNMAACVAAGLLLVDLTITLLCYIIGILYAVTWTVWSLKVERRTISLNEPPYNIIFCRSGENEIMYGSVC